ncbi:hypothetical protein PMG71_05810 [Roseofilum sp. BLCC_M154]|uniref:Uncharacterized protein n=1 Tax=Roseofilum acuticapitatum BLCC-M154 TaxID=3022444 RepID=A0ABT7ARL9_9CYAN|nr:hypothetical protein [Roseofilum acuticapitatum]MDJ1168936.1 hypothetical protein [Roseofilum acuticapitatum BLCC-M154]
MAERQVYTNRDGVAEPNALLDYERFVRSRKEGTEMATDIISSSPEGVIDGQIISWKSLKKNKVKGGLYALGLLTAFTAVPLFLVNTLVASFAPALLSSEANEYARMGNFVGRTVNYVGSTLGRPVVTELATQTYANDGKLKTTQVNQQPANYNYSSGVLLTSDGGQSLAPTQGLTQQQQEAIARLSGR